jgi:hypothetical protein
MKEPKGTVSPNTGTILDMSTTSLEPFASPMPVRRDVLFVGSISEHRLAMTLGNHAHRMHALDPALVSHRVVTTGMELVAQSTARMTGYRRGEMAILSSDDPSFKNWGNPENAKLVVDGAPPGNREEVKRMGTATIPADFWLSLKAMMEKYGNHLVVNVEAPRREHHYGYHPTPENTLIVCDSYADYRHSGRMMTSKHAGARGNKK